ncbi:hypothetical protein SSCG_04689 [Streptomyces clavuligerus]|nr:hypothetical protein SSCG_04689 [Streptomyces clavuligerus]
MERTEAAAQPGGAVAEQREGRVVPAGTRAPRAARTALGSGTARGARSGGGFARTARGARCGATPWRCCPASPSCGPTPSTGSRRSPSVFLFFFFPLLLYSS